MSTFPSIRFGRPVRNRVLVLYRVDPDVLTALLPADMRPRLHRGVAVGALCHTRLGSLRSRLLHNDGPLIDHLAYRFAVETEGRNGSVPATWVARRESSSRLGARWNGTILRRPHERARFQVAEDLARLELAVENARGEELYLRAEVVSTPPQGLFDSARSVEELIENCGEVRPAESLAADADRIEASGDFAPVPLQVLELRSAFFGDEERFPSGSVELDSVWRLITRRVAPVRVRADRFELTGGESAPAL